MKDNKKVMKPLISVIVPVYNVERCLHLCIDSLLGQTFKDFELILVDDGSKDKSGEICDKYAKKDSRIRVFHKKNGGVSSARNLGLDNVTTKYVTFCDSDDYVKPNYLSVFINGMSDKDIVISSLMYKINTGKIIPSIYNFNVSDVSLGWTILELMHEAGYPVNKCYRADIIKMNHIRFNEKYSLYEDEEFVSHYLMHARSVYFSTEITYNYCLQIERNKKYKKANIFDCVMDIYKNMKTFVPMEGIYTQAYSTIITRLLAGLIPYYESRNYKKAYSKLTEVCNIRNKMQNIYFPLDRRIRFFFRTSPKWTHRFYIFLSLINKMRG